MARFTDADDLSGAEFCDVNLRGAWFRLCELGDARFRGVDLTGAAIDGDIDGLRINGVEVGPLIEAELERLHPERAALRARDADSFRTGWAGLETMWAATMARVAALPSATVDISVDGEWSFAQTLRHLVYATDAWLGSAILARGADAYHPIGVPFTGSPTAASVVDVDAAPTYEEVLAVRAERVGMVRDFLSTLTDAQLDEQRSSPLFMRNPQYPLRDCLGVIMNEEWSHHRFAVRDLDVLASGEKEIPTAT